jgi:hypothetical protein
MQLHCLLNLYPKLFDYTRVQSLRVDVQCLKHVKIRYYILQNMNLVRVYCVNVECDVVALNKLNGHLLILP